MAPPEIAVLLYDNRKCKIVVKDADMCILEGAPGKRCTCGTVVSIRFSQERS